LITANKEGRFLPLLTTLCVLFIAYPFAADFGFLRVYRFAFLLVLLSAVYTQRGAGRRLALAGAVAIPVAVAQLTASLMGTKSTLLLGALLYLGFLTVVAVAVLRRVLAPGKVDGERIAGSVTAYLVLGLIWNMLYLIAMLQDPGAFRGPMEDWEVTELVSAGGEFAFTYYSFVTMTTLGYGDISPLSNLAQTFSWMQAVVGQLYIAILVAHQVALLSMSGGSSDD
jgi:hypothetical protein